MKPPCVPSSRLVILLLVWLLLVSRTVAGWSQDPSDSGVAARVAGFEIREPRVEAYLQRTVPGWPLPAKQQTPLRAAAVQHLVNRQLVLLALHQQGFEPTPAELEWKLDELRAELQQVGRTLDEHLADRDLIAGELRNDLDWELAWRKYLDQTLTEERLAKRYQARPRDFDGTELRVAQILLPAEPAAGQPGGLPAANRVRQQLVEGQLEWAAAVSQNSISPSRERDGDLGWIRRHEPMPEVFSQAAFELNVGELSPPIASQFGIHLIKCLDIRPGKQQFGDAREVVYRTLMEEEFRRLAAEMSGKVEVWIRPQG